MKNFTVGDGDAIMVMAAHRMGLEVMHFDDAKRQLEGGSSHPMTAASIAKEAGNANDRLRAEPALIAQANLHAEHLKAEYGFIAELSKEAFLELQAEAERLEMAHAQGQDLPSHAPRLQAIDKIMNACQWTLHPDYGVALKSSVNALA